MDAITFPPLVVYRFYCVALFTLRRDVILIIGIPEVCVCVCVCVCVLHGFGGHEKEPLLFGPNNRYFSNYNYSLIGEDPQIMRHLLLWHLNRNIYKMLAVNL